MTTATTNVSKIGGNRVKSGSKRLLSDYFAQNVSTTVDDCCNTFTDCDWLRSHFPYSERNKTVQNTLFFDLFAKLNERQLLALLKVRQNRNLFLTGSAGTGKTLWMRVAVAMCQSMGKSVAVCATTALAASNIEVLNVAQLPPVETQTGEHAYDNNYHGLQSSKRRRKPTKKEKKMFDVTPRTLHSFAGIGIDDFHPVTLGQQILTQRKHQYTLNRWKYTDTLFVDEVSMLDPQLFVALNKLAQIVRKNNRPFGGIQLICVADFFQLPPVLRQSATSKTTNSTMQTEQDVATADDAMEPDKLLSFSESEETEATGGGGGHEKEQEDDNDSGGSDDEHSAILEFRRQKSRLFDEREREQLAKSRGVSGITRAQEEELLRPVDAANARCCFQTTAWHETIDASVVLDQVFRQNNPVFIDLLCELRRGVLSAANIQRLEARTRYRLTNDLLDIAHRVFGGRGCNRLQEIAVQVFQCARQQRQQQTAAADLPQLQQQSDHNGGSLLRRCHIDTECNMSQRIASSVAESESVVPNWRRFERHVLQCCAQQEINLDLALIHMLPDEFVPESHTILVSDVKPTHIMSLNAQVEECNSRNLAAIKAPTVTFTANVSIGISNRHAMFAAAQEHFGRVFQKDTLTPLQLRLKVGAQVLLTANVLPPHFINGRRGVVLGFMSKKEFLDNEYDDDDDAAICLGLQPADEDDARYPVVKFDNGSVARVGRHSWQRQRSFSAGAKPVVAVLRQFPLVLAFACTIHKCVAGDTLVQTEKRGLVPIDELVHDYVDTKVLTHAGNFRRIVDHFIGEQEASIVIRTSAGYELECSHRHPLLVLRNCGNSDWVKAPELTVGDTLTMCRNGKMFYDKIANLSASVCQMYDIEVEQDHSFVGNGFVNHNSQGMTIGKLSVNLTRAFECGLPYVALSRGVNLESLIIEEMDRSIFDGSQPNLLPPAAVVAYYNKLERDMESVANLRRLQ